MQGVKAKIEAADLDALTNMKFPEAAAKYRIGYKRWRGICMRRKMRDREAVQQLKVAKEACTYSLIPRIPMDFSPVPGIRSLALKSPAIIEWEGHEFDIGTQAVGLLSILLTHRNAIVPPYLIARGLHASLTQEDASELGRRELLSVQRQIIHASVAPMPLWRDTGGGLLLAIVLPSEVPWWH